MLTDRALQSAKIFFYFLHLFRTPISLYPRFQLPPVATQSNHAFPPSTAKLEWLEDGNPEARAKANYFTRWGIKLMRTLSEIDGLLAAAQKDLAKLDSKRAEVLEEIESLLREKELLGQTISEYSHPYGDAPVSKQSPDHEKIALFRRLFKGREDVYPRRFESSRTGKHGYQPAFLV